jgi:hypothetical protein
MIVYLYFNIKFLKEMSKSLLYGKTERKLPPSNSSECLPLGNESIEK